MIVYTVDITAWVVLLAMFGVLAGMATRGDAMYVYMALATLFGAYSSASLFTYRYDMFTVASWLLTIFFSAATIGNIIARMYRHMMAELMELKRLMRLFTTHEETQDTG